MLCQSSTYTGFASTEPKRKYKTYPRRPSENVRKLRPAYADNADSSEDVEEAEGVETAKTANLDAVGVWLAWFLFAYLFPDVFVYWAAITAVAMLSTPAKYYLPAAAIMLAFKIIMA